MDSLRILNDESLLKMYDGVQRIIDKLDTEFVQLVMDEMNRRGLVIQGERPKDENAPV